MMKKSTICLATAMLFTASPITASAANDVIISSTQVNDTTYQTKITSAITDSDVSYINNDNSALVTESENLDNTSNEKVPYQNLGITNKKIKIYKSESEDDVVGILPKNGIFNVEQTPKYEDEISAFLAKEPEYIKVKSGEVEGYVKSEEVLTNLEAVDYYKKLTERCKTKATAFVYSTADKDNKKIDAVEEGTKVSILESANEYTKVQYDTTIGYIKTEDLAINVCKNAEPYVEPVETPTPEPTTREAPTQTPDNTTRNSVKPKKEKKPIGGKGDPNANLDLISYAKQFIGNKYVYGGNSLTNGIDCSGFTQQIYRHFGYSITRTASSQASCGRAVSYSEVQPGDLLFYGSSSRISHVAMYIGDGKIIHASNSAPYPKGGIKISNANYRSIVTIRRIIN